jgi:hypothetical protein
MNDQTIHLLFSANRWEAADGLEEKLAKGTTLVCKLLPLVTQRINFSVCLRSAIGTHSQGWHSVRLRASISTGA